MQKHFSRWLILGLLALATSPAFGQTGTDQLRLNQPPLVLPGTHALEPRPDYASELVEGVDRFLLRQLEQSIELRKASWPQPEGPKNSVQDYPQATEPLRQQYREAIGLVDPRVQSPRLTLDREVEVKDANGRYSSSIGTFDGGNIYPVRWPVHEGVEARGLLIVPESQPASWNVVLVPDAGQMPEDLCGSENGNSVAIELARYGARVLIPQVVSRHREARNGRVKMTDQEYLYRSAFVLGRHLLGHQVQQCIAALDALQQSDDSKPIAIAGWGEGGWVALAAGVSETRFDAVLVSGHFGPKETIWKEPIHRNVHGLLTAFGDAQLAALVAPRPLIVDTIPGPTIDIPGEGGAPGLLHGPSGEQVELELQIARDILKPWKLDQSLSSIRTLATVPNPSVANESGRPTPQSIAALAKSLAIASSVDTEKQLGDVKWERLPDRELRRIELLKQWDRYQQRILDLAHIERGEYWKKLDTSSLAKFEETIIPYRRDFSERVIGRWDREYLPANPRTRLIYDEPKWTGYEVVLDVYDDVIAYGVLLVPKSDQPIKNHPCVVFQHGLEGRPSDTIVGDHPAYHDVSARLVEEGYVVFAPQNLYLFTDRFRTLQRKSNLLGKTLFSTIIAQHQQIVRWLGQRDEIDPNRIAFYGLSYGGKSAMRIPALVPEYCLSICSADFNDWVWKNASTSAPHSYVWTMEYEIFEFDLGRKFNYAEMATLIAPRPFMVERGHFDGVAPDERVGLEYAKVQNLYAAKLMIADRTEIEWFVGPHTINGIGTFAFLRKHLGNSH
ncbi:MAG: dienelactone hydrolase family protein [Planctomycetes bacterium]|nr:dienelactone hydrolase family protein [Planctomycetota bacterium]